MRSHGLTILLIAIAGCNTPAKFAAHHNIAQLHDALKEMNPGYKGGGRFVFENDQLVEVTLLRQGVTNLSPLVGAPIRSLYCRAGNDEQRVKDLSPLCSMPLEGLFLDYGGEELRALNDLRLNRLLLDAPNVTAIDCLEGMPLESLQLFNTNVENIDVVASMPLHTLEIYGTDVEDLTPLEHIAIRQLAIDPIKIRMGQEVLWNIDHVMILRGEQVVTVESITALFDEYWPGE